jgi:hypothetical protein
MEKLNDRLKELEEWKQDDIYLLVDNAKASPCRLKYMYDTFNGNARITNRKTLSSAKYDLYYCSELDQMLRVIYALDTGDSTKDQQSFLVVGCDRSNIQATFLQAWDYLGQTTVKSNDIIQLLDDTFVEANYLPGTLVECGYSMPNGKLFKLEQYRSFGKPNVATIVVDECSPLEYDKFSCKLTYITF